MEVEIGTRARPPWLEEDGIRHRTRVGDEAEWMPRPFAGRILLERTRMPKAEQIYVQVVPGPQGLWQIVRVDLDKPFARGFRTPELARRWLGRAVKAGIVPQGTMELEPMQEEPMPDGNG